MNAIAMFILWVWILSFHCRLNICNIYYIFIFLCSVAKVRQEEMEEDANQ